MKRSLALALLSATLLSPAAYLAYANAQETVQEQAAPAVAAEQDQAAELHKFFADSFETYVASSPTFQSHLGRKTDYDKWDDLSEEKISADYERMQGQLKQLHERFEPSKLSPQDQENYRVFEAVWERELAQYQWRHHDYPLNQMFGWQSEIPSFMITVHSIDNVDEAKAYIARLRGVKHLTDQIIEGLKMRETKGVVPPKFVFGHVATDINNLLKGKPLDDSTEDHVLLADFKAKIAKLKLPQAEHDALVVDAQDALKTSFGPGYKNMLAFVTDQETRATTDDGVWKLPNGEEYYKARLRYHTTTGMTADEIHELGMKEVARIHEEMKGILKQIGFQGTLQEFFAQSHTSDKFHYPNTDEARQDYLKVSHQYLDGMNKKLPEAFKTLPKAQVEIRPVEAFREKSAGIGFYQQPAPDGTRPGLFYVNLYNMQDVPKTEIEALVYHEANPGHHMQISIAQELQDMPEFRKFIAHFTAYIEGWGLYSERLGKDMGFYTDPYSDFGRLTMELFRAIRLVVDTGLHAKKWTREQAIQYLKDNYPGGDSDAIKAIERYIVMPGQATAYKIGMNTILEAREKAKLALGDKFNLGEFHDAVLLSGALPLDMMEANVQKWVDSKLKP